jgi:short-subunit dehydrogenase
MSDKRSTTSQGKSDKGTAVVTGASAGIGKLFADRLARRGYDLILVARRADRLDAVAKDLQTQYGVSVRTLVADLGDADELETVAQSVSTDQDITMLVNNAGTSTLGSVAEAKKADLEAMINVNIMALTRLTIAVLPTFKKRNNGTIINIGSVLGFQSLPISSIYSGTKGYVLNFTRGLQDELADTKIVVQLVAPAAIATDIWDISGVPLSNLDPATVMTAEHVVDAALSGLDLREKITLPSVDDLQLLANYDSARMTLLKASQTSKPANRYSITQLAEILAQV